MTNRIEEFIREIEQQGRDMEPSIPIPNPSSTAVSEASLWIPDAVSLETTLILGGGAPFIVNWVDPFTEMRRAIEKLEARVTELEEEVQNLRVAAQEEVVVLRTVSREQAKMEIRELFQSGETLFYSDIARRLGIDLPLVVEICQELEEEGEIQVDADSI